MSCELVKFGNFFTNLKTKIMGRYAPLILVPAEDFSLESQPIGGGGEFFCKPNHYIHFRYFCIALIGS